MSHRTPTKTYFGDEFREDAACLKASKEEPAVQTAWDNIDEGTWEKDNYVPSPLAQVAKQICLSCPVRELCLVDAIEDNEAEGIRGGYRFENGYVMREDARKIYGQFELRAKVKKNSRLREKSPEMSEVQPHD